jgi:8-oxo-dGTP pyrophosphatase MutT (NUDIX family)
MSKWQRLSGKVVYQNKYVSIHEDEVITPDGRSAQYGWMETPPAVFIVAVNAHKQVCLVEQERYLSGHLSWEVPAGNTDGEDELEAAKRELAEEAGLHAEHWQRLPGDIYPFNSLAAERDIIYIATKLHDVKEPITGTDDVITGKRWVSWSEVKELVATAEITDGQTICALALSGLHLGTWN